MLGVAGSGRLFLPLRILTYTLYSQGRRVHATKQVLNTKADSIIVKSIQQITDRNQMH